jgi:alkanesulfonate monooxygenase SsuD/methylene tetrahydromethanopterin reductase-like flavin-dependent oxidoreductase (luciferase family)
VELHFHFAAQDGTHPWNPGGTRVSDFNYMQQLAGAIDHDRYAGALIATLSGGTNPWTMATGLAITTNRMKFIVAQYAGVIAPLWMEQMAASVDQISNDRSIINIINDTGNTAPQLGICIDHDTRYELADEYWGVFRRLMQGETVDFEGVGTGTSIVGDPESVVAASREYESAGAEVFILGNYPHVEEAYRFPHLVMPLLGHREGKGRISWY